jgi:hypothetical protein
LSHQRGCHETEMGTPASAPSVPQTISNCVRAFVVSVWLSKEVRTIGIDSFRNGSMPRSARRSFSS